MTTSTGPPGLPSRLLADPEMVAACASRQFDAVFRLAKARGGFHASRIARVCELTPSRVGEVMAGKRKITDMTVIERIADGLRIPGHMVGLAARQWERPSTPARPASPRAAAEVQPPRPPAPASGLPNQELDDILAIAAGTRVTPTALRSLQASIEDYWRRDDEHGGEALRPAVIGQLRYVLDIMRDTNDPNYQRSLHGIAAELARLTGWTYFDARHYSTARTYFTEALRLAREINDRPFIANVLACLSLQATYEEKTRNAIVLTRAAQDSARLDGATPRLMAMLSMREAYAHASAKDSQSTHSAIEDAHRHFDRISPGDDDPAWVRYFDLTKLTVDTGIALGQLGDATAAEPLIAQALRAEPTTNQRGRAFHTFWLARTQLERRQVELACGTAEQALDLAAGVASPRVLAHLKEFSQSLRPYGTARPVAELTDRIRGIDG
jgi:tetratricopeptide (TPR) repeat protein